VPLRTGLASLVPTHLEAGSAIAVAGVSAAEFAEDLVRCGAPPLAVEADSAAEVPLENPGGLWYDFVPEGVRSLRDGHEVG